MGTDPWWAWLLGLLFAAPWLVAIAWIWLRTPPPTTEAPSLAELVRSRWTS
jgi:hypothetical protein